MHRRDLHGKRPEPDNISGRQAADAWLRRYLDPNHWHDGPTPETTSACLLAQFRHDPLGGGPARAMRRWSVAGPAGTDQRAGIRRAHPGAFNAVFCDGSVRAVKYEIDPEVHRRMANRKDGLVVEVDGL